MDCQHQRWTSNVIGRLRSAGIGIPRPYECKGAEYLSVLYRLYNPRIGLVFISLYPTHHSQLRAHHDLSCWITDVGRYNEINHRRCAILPCVKSSRRPCDMDLSPLVIE